MENNQNPNQPQNANKPDKGGLIIIGIIAVVIIAVIIYFVVQNSGNSNNGGTAAKPPADMGELLELNDLNIHGSWFRDEADGSRYEIRFSANNVLHFYMYDTEGNTVAESDEGTYATENDKLYLSIIAGGAVYEDICTAMVSINVLFISADEGTGLFNGTYLSEYQVPDYLPGDDSEDENNSQSETEATTTTTTEATTTTTTTTVTEPSATEYHLPDIVGELFSMTAEEYFGANVPTTNKLDFVTGQATYDVVYRSGHTVQVSYHWAGDYEHGIGQGTGYPIMLTFDIQDIFPDLSSYTYAGLQEALGDKAQYSLEDELFGYGEAYDIWTELDGYVIHFNDYNYVGSLDSNLWICVVYYQ